MSVINRAELKTATQASELQNLLKESGKKLTLQRTRARFKETRLLLFAKERWSTPTVEASIYPAILNAAIAAEKLP
jgi:hypothetical protein